MSSFTSVNFLFDGEFSENYGLHIKSINGGGVENFSAGSNIEVIGDSLYRKPTKYFYGTTYNDVLSFDMEVMSDSPIIGPLRTKIEKWLFGRLTYSKLQIIQTDLQDVFFNCFLVDPEVIYVGNFCYGFSFTVECDAPWAWEIESHFDIINESGVYERTFKIYNDSDIEDYTYPNLEFKINQGGGDFSLINNSDNGRMMSFTGLPANELVTIDCENHIIICSSVDYVSDRFNKKFFRLVPSSNLLTFKGNIEYLKIRYNNARKVGG